MGDLLNSISSDRHEGIAILGSFVISGLRDVGTAYGPL